MRHFIGPMYFCKLVFIGVATSLLCGLLETPLAVRNLKVVPQDFQYILTWENGNDTKTPTYYSVTYNMNSFRCLLSKTLGRTSSESEERTQLQPVSSNPERKMIKECTNITHLFCNLTEEFTDFCKTYVIIVKQVTENRTNSSALHFTPYLQTCLSPPQFNISACPNCINVTVKLSSSLLKVYHELDYTISMYRAGIKETLILNTTRTESFYTVLDPSPNANYCIAVDVESSLTQQCAPSPPKCNTISSGNKSGLITLSAVAGVSVPLAVLCSLLFLYMAGYICLRIKEWPNALSSVVSSLSLAAWPGLKERWLYLQLLPITPGLDYLVFESDPEDVQTLQAIQKRGERVWDYRYDADSGSDGENDGPYTNRRLLGKISKSCSKANIIEQLSSDCSSATSDCQTVELLDADVEDLQYDINEEENTAGQVFFPASEVNSPSVPEPENSGCLNINLDTVMLGTLNKNWEASETLMPYQEDAGDLQEPCISDASEPKHFINTIDIQSSNVQNLSWQYSSESGESESSDSETDCIGEYMKR